MNCLYCPNSLNQEDISNEYSIYDHCDDCNVTYISDLKTKMLNQYYYPFKMNNVEYRYIVQYDSYPVFHNNPERVNTMVIRMKNGIEEKCVLQFDYIDVRINPKNVQDKIKTYLVFS